MIIQPQSVFSPNTELTKSLVGSEPGGVDEHVGRVKRFVGHNPVGPYLEYILFRQTDVLWMKSLEIGTVRIVYASLYEWILLNSFKPAWRDGGMVIDTLHPMP